MAVLPKNRAIVALLSLGSITYAQIARICPDTDVCYSLNIPDATASSGSGDVYFQISSPTTNSWVALGQGTSMSGANIFVIYTSADGNNVTISPRLGRGHSEPNFNSDAQITLLEGSGVSNGIMTANILCSNCESWSGGDTDFSGDSGSFIWAQRPGDPLNSDDQSESISRHDDHGTFQFRFSSATGGDSVNPFRESSGSGTSSTNSGQVAATNCVPRPSSTTGGPASLISNWPSSYPSNIPEQYRTKVFPDSWSTAWPTTPPASWTSRFGDDWHGPWQSGRYGSWPTGSPWSGKRSYGYGTGDDDSENTDDNTNYCDEDGETTSGSTNTGVFGASNGGFADRDRTMLIAHGVLACLAFAIFFPVGGILIRVFSFPGLVWVHAAFQVMSYFLFIAGAGLGLYIATKADLTDRYHPVIGVILLVLIFFQPFLGILHHFLFQKYSARTFWSYAHIWLGRVAITLGIINGGLGFKLANNTTTGPIIYGVVAGIVWLTWVVSMFYGERKRRNKAMNEPPKYTERSPVPSNESVPRREYYAKPEGT
ncbi:iron reductase domain protein [Patellaria atrata CBS 101060]|uniref:Iron reductase domain protein n=1 Tax=Patellaria atrata CBS 101060 TaxID=1346257 RepID=A0A9P4S300_9PEZI|nr:iron reductase domain protein [Patellaria atrata CBS 101060]